MRTNSKPKTEEKSMDFLDSFSAEGPRGPAGINGLTNKEFKYKVKVDLNTGFSRFYN